MRVGDESRELTDGVKREIEEAGFPFVIRHGGADGEGGSEFLAAALEALGTLVGLGLNLHRELCPPGTLFAGNF